MGRTFGGIVFVMFLYYVPYAYLFVVGALKNMDPALEEAARTVSAGVVATMLRVTLPLMLPALLSSALLVFVLAAELFSVPAMLGARVQIHTIPTVIYFGFQYGNVPVGEVSALATMLLWVTAAGIFLYRRTVALSRRYVTVSGKGYRARPIELGPWRWAGWGLVTLYVLVAVVLPYLALLLGSFLKFLTPKLRPQSFTLDNYARITEPGTLVAIQNTLLLAVVAATATVLLAFVVSYLIVRGRGRVAVAMDYLSSLPVAIPGMALAVGLLGAYTTLPVPIYGTIAMLLVAYMTRFAQRYPSQMSGGQQQRVAVARSLVIEPQVLLFDEPLSNLDARVRERVRLELRELLKRLGITSIYVTHDQAEAMAIADRIVVMNHGRIEQEGDARALYERPATRFVAEFFGWVNFIRARVSSPGRHGMLTAFESADGLTVVSTIAAAGGTGVVGFRPEHVRLVDQPGPPNTWPARVEKHVYLGRAGESHAHIGSWLIRVPDLDVAAGREVLLHVPPERVFYFPAAES